MTITQNFFLQIEGAKEKNSKGELESTTDFTIVPIEFKMVIYVAFRDGIKTRFGSTPEISIRRIGMEGNNLEGELKIKDCIYIKNPDFK